MSKKQKPPQIKSLLILAKHTDGKVRQVLADDQTQRLILSAIVQNSETHSIRVEEKAIDYLDWQCETDLTKKP